MVKTIQGLISPDDIKWFQEDMAKKIATEYVDRPYETEQAKRIYGLDDCSVIDRRHILEPESEGFKRIRDIAYQIVDPGTYIYAAYQRQFLPHSLHVDALGENSDVKNAYSAIIPLEDNVDGIFKTIVWNKVFHYQENFQEFIRYFLANKETMAKESNASELYEVDHCWEDKENNIVDYMPLDGSYTYELGTIGVFHRTHVHCSSNWRKPGLWDHKDVILLHLG